MTGLVLVAFVAELAAASMELGIEAPPVVPVHGECHGLVAWVPHTPKGFEPEVRVCDTLRGSPKFVRCAARHEATHVALRHYEMVQEKGSRKRWEAEVDAFTKARWKEPKQCGVY